ncbi:MAG TPA: hypothetical protein VNZ22_11135 [Bacillota bacterium]|nr:hypothetical protein [Bacillota bacterium]
MREYIDEGRQRHGTEQQETNNQDHGQGENPVVQKNPKAVSRLCHNTQNRIERSLQLVENTARAEHQRDRPDDSMPT